MEGQSQVKKNGARVTIALSPRDFWGVRESGVFYHSVQHLPIGLRLTISLRMPVTGIEVKGSIAVIPSQLLGNAIDQLQSESPLATGQTLLPFPLPLPLPIPQIICKAVHALKPQIPPCMIQNPPPMPLPFGSSEVM